MNQCELHPFCQRKELVSWCKGKGIAFEGYCPLARCKRFDDAKFKPIVEAVGKTPAQVMIRWALQHGIITIPKSSNPERIVENADVFSWSLSDEHMAALDKLEEDWHCAWDPTVGP